MNFSEASIKLTKNLSKETKKNEGIYFTPKSIVQKMVDFVLDYKPKSILEPSCGSGQFLEYFSENITAIEKNVTIYNVVSENYKVINADFLKYQFTSKFDLVIGNPPYFVVPKSSVDKRYHPFFTGRPNIYILFIIKSFELLNPGGILAFVLPTNFLNCIYYNELRKYLMNFKILDIHVTSDKFLETCQEICIFIIQKSEYKSEDFYLHFDNIVLFKPKDDLVKIKKLIVNSTTLANLGCKLNIGTVVWNQCKNLLTTDESKPLLIYSGDIKDNKLDIQAYRDSLKKNYINKTGFKDKILLVNRGYGTGKYNLNYCIIDPEKDKLLKNGYLVENHCIVIHNETSSLLDKITRSFENPKTKEFIDIIFSNNAINIEEFLYILPIFI